VSLFSISRCFENIPLRAAFALFLFLVEIRQEFGMDWVHPWIGLDWVRIFKELYGLGIGLGGMTVTPFLISNHCNTVDAVSFKL